MSEEGEQALHLYARQLSRDALENENQRLRDALKTARAYIARYGFTEELLRSIDAALGPNVFYIGKTRA